MKEVAKKITSLNLREDDVLSLTKEAARVDISLSKYVGKLLRKEALRLKSRRVKKKRVTNP